MLKHFKNHYKKHYEGTYAHAKKLFAFDLVLLFFAAVMIAGNVFLFLWKPSLVDLIDISLSLGGQRIRSGEEVVLTVKYVNKSKFRLKDTSLAVRLPTGFIIDRNKTPKEIFSDQGVFTAPTELPAGASGQGEIYGTFWTETNLESHILATLTYKPENRGAPEQKLSSLVALLPDSVLTSELELPPSAFANSQTKFKYTLKNNGKNELKNLNVVGEKEWQIQLAASEDGFSLLPNETKVIGGSFIAPNKTGSNSFSIAAEVTIGNTRIFQAKQTKNFTVIAPQIFSSLTLTNLSYVEPSQTIPLEIAWDNKSEIELQNLTLHLTSNFQNVIDWKKTAQENHAKAEPNGIFFDSNSRTNLGNSGQKNDKFNIKIFLLPRFNLPPVENAKLAIYPIMKAGAGEVAGQQFSQAGDGISLPLATETRFSSAEARYYTDEGDQLGRGPLPPKIGRETKYWIFVRISNTSNAIEDAVFSTSLPEGVEFTGKQSTTIGPQLKYSNADRSISWKYDSLPANSQTGLYFEVATTPKSSQAGQNIQLTNTLRFSATDSFINKKIEFSHSPINNILNKNDSGFNLGSKVTQ